MQSDPHDARILKAFALGLAVATRGMDHLRNRVTLEINARINDDPAFKERLYGAPVSAAPNSYEQQGARGSRLREHLRASATPSACAASRRNCSTARRCRASKSSRRRSANVTGLEFAADELDRIGLNIMGVERLINRPPRRPPRATTRCPTAGSTSRSPSARTRARSIDRARVRRDADALLRDLEPRRRKVCRRDGWRQQLEAVLGA